MTNAAWECGDMADGDGFVGRPVPAGKILVPGSITLETDPLNLSWNIDTESRFVTPDASMLNEFVALCKKPPLAVVSFAKQWGVLATTKHNRPCAEGATSGRDSIQAWRFYSSRALAVLNLIAAIKLGKIGDIQDWKALGVTDDSTEELERVTSDLSRFPLPQLMGMGLPKTKYHACTAIAQEVNEWMTVWREQRIHAVSDFRVETTVVSDRC
jgi:hypothetical protein